MPDKSQKELQMVWTCHCGWANLEHWPACTACQMLRRERMTTGELVGWLMGRMQQEGRG